MFWTVNVRKISTIIMIMLAMGAIFILMEKENAVTTQGEAMQRVDVVLDAGHGDFDGGTSGASGVLEKDLNLAITQKVRDILVANGISVGMTRDADAAIEQSNKYTIRHRKNTDLNYRKSFIASSGAKVLVSVHMNAFEQSQYKGAQVFYSSNLPSSKEFGEELQKALREGMNDGNKREAKRAESSVFLLKTPPMTAVLVECGFLSNKEEEELLKTEEYQQKMAEVIAKSIMAWIAV